MKTAQIGIYGLGTMGSALALNMADKGIDVAVTNRDTALIEGFVSQAGNLAGGLLPFETLESFVKGVQSPRVILFMIPSGAPMDSMIDQIIPLLAPGDTIIDGGNANFHDTRRRSKKLAEMDLHFVGMGVSGGEEGARFGPSMMVGGTEHSWQQLRPILRKIAAKFGDDPCVDRLGPDGAGHFVKTVHNGIEYADMQMIAEIYGLMRVQPMYTPAKIGAVFDQWNRGELQSYLVEITGSILQATDAETEQPMVDVIVDRAGQKGTGRWTAIEALKLGNSVSTIEAAVAARSWSADIEARAAGQGLLAADGASQTDGVLGEADLENGLLAAKIIAYSQGFSLLKAADDEFRWGLDLARTAEIWRAGCIIRSAMLDDMAKAVRNGLPHGHLMLADVFSRKLKSAIPSLRKLVAHAALGGHPVPAFAAALSYYDTMRQARGTTNLIQAQRDFFGAHGFERVDGGSGQHGPWAMNPR